MSTHPDGPRTTCGSPCPRHQHACARTPGHCGGGCRDRAQKGTQTCTWYGDEIEGER